MFDPRHSHRPRAGSFFAGLALLSVLTLLGSPLAALGHHHDESASAAVDASCSVCLWQSHHAAELTDAPGTAAVTVAPLAVAAPSRRIPALEPPRLSARAPPSASV